MTRFTNYLLSLPAGSIVFSVVATAAVLASLIFSAPAQACERTPVANTAETLVSYIVTDDPRTADALGIELVDNTDYEADATERLYDDGTPYCERLALDAGAAGQHIWLTWYECTVPSEEAPEL